MPQMAPLSWVTLLVYFILVFMLFNTLNFFSINYCTKKSINKKTQIIYNWKW